jgi:predicted nucleic acid-binding protein
VVLAEEADYWSNLRSLLQAARVAGPEVHDARIAALCLHHGADELWTADRDFNRYPRLTAINPLID